MVLLLALAFFSAIGTIIPQGMSEGEYNLLMGSNLARLVRSLHLADLFHAPWYRFILASLMVNMLVCIVLRLPSILSSLSGKKALMKKPVLETDDSSEQRDRIADVLRRMGFKERRRGAVSVFSTGATGYICTVISHLSLLVIIGFSFAGSTMGFVGTQRVYVGQSTETYYNWKERSDKPLPFELYVEDFNITPHPTGVKMGVLEKNTGRKGKEITTHVGGTFRVPGVHGKVTVTSFDTEKKTYKALWQSPGGESVSFGTGDEIGSSGVTLVVTAYAYFPEKAVVATTVLREGSKVLNRGDIAPNQPLNYEGLFIYLTDYGKDRFGFPFVGYQIVRDPGRTGVWTGCILFLISVTGAIFLRYRCAVLRSDSGRLFVHISGMSKSVDPGEDLAALFRDAIGYEDPSQ